MPKERYRGRYAEVYLPSEKFLDKWKQRAKESRMPLSSWIFATVEAVLDGLSEPSEELADQGEALREDNRKLRRDAEKNESRIRELETEVFNLRHNAVLSQSSGDAPYSTTLIKIIRRGGTWSNRDLLAELGVLAGDSNAIEIVARQLRALQDAGLVAESARGWRWIK